MSIRLFLERFKKNPRKLTGKRGGKGRIFGTGRAYCGRQRHFRSGEGDGCLNFFAGPADPDFSATINFFKLHYEKHHLAGISGGNAEDLEESLQAISKKILNPSVMITHIGGLNVVPETTKHLPDLPGGKKLIYVQKNIELTALEDFKRKGKTDPFFADLHAIVSSNNDLWSKEAEDYLLRNAPAV